jgi:hypothetical protein
MRRDSIHLSDLAARLAPRIGELARAVLGAEPTSRSRTEWRFGSKGAVAVVTAGPKIGMFYDHSEATGGDGLGLIQHALRCTKAEAIAWAAAWDGTAPLRASPARPAAARSRVQAASPTLALAWRVWGEGAPPHGTLAERYLARRGLTLPADAPARFHGACPRGKTERHPALLWLLTDPVTGEPVGVQRVFLTAQGDKAPGVARMVAGGMGVIRLVPDEDVTTGLGIAEGAETGLSVMQRFGWRPVWAAVSAGGVAAFPVLSGIEAITIWADSDDPGLNAAQACAVRWQDANREALIRKPPAGDFNDAIREAV